MGVSPQAGFVYILTNPAMPGLVKIGKSTRHPADRVKELSSATGVPVPFELNSYVSFNDCSVAERLIHRQLEVLGVRQAGNREFFQMPPEDAYQRLLMLQLELAGENVESLAERLHSDAMAQYQGASSSVPQLTQVFIEFEHAASLGSLPGRFMAGISALALSDKKRNDEEALFFAKKGREYLKLASSEGIVRAELELHRHHKNQARHEDSLAHWDAYLTSMVENNFPEEELQELVPYLVSAIDEGAPSLAALRHPVLRKKSVLLYLAAIRFKLPRAQRDALLSFCNPGLSFLKQRAKVPLLLLSLCAVVFLFRPDLIIIGGFAGLFGMGLLSMLKRRKGKRRAKPAKPRKRTIGRR